MNTTMTPDAATHLNPRSEAGVFYVLAAIGGLITAIGLGAALYMEHEGHVVTGMTNHIVWGITHVFAIFLIFAASGVLNVASIGSVFGKTIYKSRAPRSGLLSIAMLAGGLMVIMLDLGRADRIIVAATHFNPTSVFGWNVILYPGMFAIVGVYLWTMMERRMNPWSKPAGFAAFIWRILLTTGTGSIFAFLGARAAYGSALLAPFFIVLSFAWGLAVFMVVQAALYYWNDMRLPAPVLKRMKNLLGLFVAATLYFTAVLHLTNAYFAKQVAFEAFLLFNSEFAPVFWIGQVLLGSLLPLALIWHPVTGQRQTWVTLAALLVIIGAFCQLWVFIIGGQAYPLDIFPGYNISSSFMDGVADHYAPRLPEILLGLGGFGVAFTATTIGVRVLRFMPQDDIGQLEAAGSITD
jgi:molybdopterin-containing oxidoreductase family membrane subunit